MEKVKPAAPNTGKDLAARFFLDVFFAVLPAVFFAAFFGAIFFVAPFFPFGRLRKAARCAAASDSLAHSAISSGSSYSRSGNCQ